MSGAAGQGRVAAALGPLRFAGREAWPALDAGLRIFERQAGGRSGDELLRRVQAAAAAHCDLPPLLLDAQGCGAVEFTAGAARHAVCNAMLCNGADPAAALKPQSRRASPDGAAGGGLAFGEWLHSSAQLAAEKAACVLHYLDAATTAGFDERRVVRLVVQRAPELDAAAARCTAAWPSVRVHTGDFCQRGEDTTFVNFGNAVFLYGKLSPSETGVTVEEFLQVEHPELLVGLLYVGQMDADQVVAMENVRRFSSHTGYMASFACAGATDDKRLFTVLTMDAKNYNPDLERPAGDFERHQQVCYGDQFLPQNSDRDVGKAAAAFWGRERVSTGKWGCGVFAGNVYLKLLQQLLAARIAGVRELSFSAYRREDEAGECTRLAAAVIAASPELSAAELLTILRTLPCEELGGDGNDAAFAAHVTQRLRRRAG
eukprot:TRINITY_DN37360_c0_g1_i1.p1 TRINITY_DN37360_c0_g1~~TRINITY_DN37360_c0_g1_i1.p1  ORF type:complete len:452 (+),score=155.35 TRINITY_DN37360_c0_g1_i1:69-1358(+)